MLSPFPSLLGRLDCRVFGQGRPLVLLHGIQGTAEAWLPVAQRLADTHRCVLPNLPGRAASPRWHTADDGPIERYYHLDHYAGLLHELLQAIGQPVVLAGWSMGVSVILRMAALHGLGAVERLVLVSGTMRAGPPEATWFHAADIDALRSEARQRAERLGLTQVADAEAVAWSWQSARGLDLSVGAARIACPTRVVHGETDDQCPLAHGRALAAAIAGAQWLALPGVGHNVLGAEPARLAAAITAENPR